MPASFQIAASRKPVQISARKALASNDAPISRTVVQHINQSATELQEDMEALKHNFLLRGFFKKRGYEDSADLTKYEIASLPAGSAEQDFTYDAGKLFNKADSAQLKDPLPRPGTSEKFTE